jgi:hypothetical protein
MEYTNDLAQMFCQAGHVTSSRQELKILGEAAMVCFGATAGVTSLRDNAAAPLFGRRAGLSRTATYSGFYR